MAFMTNHNIKEDVSVLIITEEDLLKAGCFNIPESIMIAEKAFLQRSEDKLIVPDKVSVVFDAATQNRINCLPAGSFEDEVFGMKWISVFPDNPTLHGIQNVCAVILLSDLKTGFPKAFMAGTLCSNLRTAATSAVAAKHLARKDSQTIGFIGAGAQAKSHFMTLKHVCPSIKLCKVSSRTSESEKIFIEQMSRLYPEVEFVACGGSYEMAACNSDIIVTAISAQEKILQSEWIAEGAFYCHVAGLEDDFSVAKKADKIVCDDWEIVKHRTQTISQMFKCGLLKDDDIYGNLTDIVSGKLEGRTSEHEFIYFNTVGMSFIDIALADYMYNKVKEHGLGTQTALQKLSMFDVAENYIKK